MKQKQNKWFITAFVLLGIGMGLMGIAKQLSGNRISIKNGLTHLFEDANETHHIDETITFDQQQSASVKSIMVDCVVGTIRICQWDQDYLEANWYSDEEALKPAVTLENDCLDLTIRAEWDISSFDLDNNAKAGITLYLPKTMTLDYINAQMDAGIVEIDAALVLTDGFKGEVNAGQLVVRNLTAKRIECQVNAGQLCLNDGQCQFIEASVNAGQLKIDNLKSEQSEFEVNAGQGVVAGCFRNQTELSVNAGTMDFTNTLKLEETAVRLDIQTGSVRINDQKYSGMSKDFTFGEPAGNLLIIDVETGSVKVHYQN